MAARSFWPQRTQAATGWRWPGASLLLPFVAGLLMAIGGAALVTAGSVVILPHEANALGFELATLYGWHPRQALVAFIVHNRVSFGGLLIVTGLLYWWLARSPLGGGQRWAWWTLCLSGGVGSASYFAYSSHGYWDWLHGAGTLAIAVCLRLGLARAWGRTVPPSAEWRARLPRPALSRLLLTLWGGGTCLGGLAILGVGMLPVFVATDLAFLDATARELAGLHGSVVPFIAHDRIGFGGALLASGIAIVGIVWSVPRQEFAGVWPVLALAWAIGAATAIGVHPLVGYNSLAHLAPFLVKDGAFLLAVGAFWLGR